MLLRSNFKSIQKERNGNGTCDPAADIVKIVFYDCQRAS